MDSPPPPTTAGSVAGQQKSSYRCQSSTEKPSARTGDTTTLGAACGPHRILSGPPRRDCRQRLYAAVLARHYDAVTIVSAFHSDVRSWLARRSSEGRTVGDQTEMSGRGVRVHAYFEDRDHHQ